MAIFEIAKKKFREIELFDFTIFFLPWTLSLSVYNISETDPSDILGQDILEQEMPKFFDNDNSEDAFDNVPFDFDVLQNRLERERRRRGSGQKSGDSFFEQRSSGDSYIEQ